MFKREIKELLNSWSYPNRAKNLRMKETYISWLLFAGGYVYKIKKPVKFSYLDFSTIQKRKYFLEEELRLNRRISKDIYLGLSCIVRKGHNIKIVDSLKPRLAKKEKIIDYALKMREVPAKYYVSELIKSGKLKKHAVNKIAKTLADFHKKTGKSHPRKGARQSFSKVRFRPFLQIFRRNWEENFENLNDFIGKTIRKPIFNFIRFEVTKFLKENQQLFKKRANQGMVKDCHGDFHSGNIFVSPAKVYVIDCIEFNERFRIADSISDAAFFAMDLEFLGRKDLADYFIERYTFWSKDKEGLRLLDFYKCYYAFVKGKVATFSSKKEQAQRYFSLAFQYARDFSKLLPLLIVIFGRIGTGKTSLARRLSEITGFTHLRSDVIRKEIFKVPIFSHPRLKFREKMYGQKANQKVYTQLIKNGQSLISKSKSVILDATFSQGKFRDKVANLAEKLKIDYCFIECSLPEKIILKRLEKRKKEREVSDADTLIYLQHKKLFEPVKNLKGHYFKISAASSIDSEVDKVLQSICTRFARA